MNPREIFFQTLDLVKQGKIDQAEPLCQQLLQLNPREVNSLRLYGQIQQRKGNLKLARELMTKAVTIAPDYAHGHMDLGLIAIDANQHSQAITHLKQAIHLDPQLTPAKRALHDCYLASGDLEAAKAMAQSLGVKNQLVAQIQQAHEYFRHADYKAMEDKCKAILEQDPGNMATLRLLAEYASRDSNPLRAERLYRGLLKRAQENWRAWNGLARALAQQDRTEEAFESLQRSREINPTAAETQAVTADTHIRRYEYQQGITIFEALLQQQPSRNSIRSQLGLALKTVGNTPQAIEYFLQCIERDETFGEAYWALSDMKTFAFSDEQLHTMQRVWQQELPDKDKVYLGYGIGKALEHRKEYQAAFAHYRQANERQKQLLEYSFERHQQLTDQLIETFQPEVIARLQRSVASDVTPIFVVSLPRSGSTLQEQILASHSQVEGTQELPYLTRMASMLHRGPKAMSKQPFPMGFAELDPEQINTLAKHYLDKAEFHRIQKKPYFIDKLPNNFLYLGIAAICFPNAKFINAKRHPMDSCLGCYKQLWAKGQHFTYSLQDLGHYYQDYHRLMQHWHRVFPGRILDVQYESVVDDLDSNVRRVLDFCGLEFEQACLNFHETKRVVKTSSSEQVRKPIYRSALAYWKNFEEELKPLREILGDLVTD